MIKLLFLFFVLISSGMLDSSVFACERRCGWNDMGNDFEGFNHYDQKEFIDFDGHSALLIKKATMAMNGKVDLFAPRDWLEWA